MRAVKILFVLLITVFAINFIRGSDYDFPLPQVLPFGDGKRPTLLHTGAGIILVLLCVWGLGRIGRIGEDTRICDELDDSEYESVSDFDEDDSADEEQEEDYE